MDLSYFALGTSDYYAWGGLIILLAVAKASRTETRTLLAAVALSVVSPSPASLYVTALFTLAFMLLDALHIGRS